MKFEKDWRRILQNTDLSTDFLEKHIDKFILETIFTYQYVPEWFIEKYADKYCWGLISSFQKLSEEFIEKHFNKLDLDSITKKQPLSESLLERYINNFNLKDISLGERQKLSDEFAQKYDIENSILAIRYHCGEYNRPVKIFKDTPEHIMIGCFVGTKKQALEEVMWKYGQTTEGEIYRNKIKECFEEAENENP